MPRIDLGREEYIYSGKHYGPGIVDIDNREAFEAVRNKHAIVSGQPSRAVEEKKELDETAGVELAPVKPESEAAKPVRTPRPRKETREAPSKSVRVKKGPSKSMGDAKTSVAGGGGSTGSGGSE